MERLSAFAAGLVFGLGLLLSGMVDPAKVLAFLDLASRWDPSLAMVMGGAVAVAALGFAWLARRPCGLLGQPLQWPTATRIEARLGVGALLFGIGWGLAGYCPGPALVSLTMGVPQAGPFVLAMLVGMGAFEALEAQRRRRAGAC